VQIGFSVRSIERFCQENGIRRKAFITDELLDEVVSKAVSQVILNNYILDDVEHDIVNLNYQDRQRQIIQLRS